MPPSDLIRACKPLAQRCQHASAIQLAQEVDALSDFSDEIELDGPNRRIRLADFPYPPRWSRREAPLLFVLPKTYDRAPPDVYLHEDQRYDGGVPRIMLRRNLGEFRAHCITKKLAREWKPHDTTITVAKMIVQSLRHPNKKDSWQSYTR